MNPATASISPQDYWNMVMRKKWLALAIFILSVSAAAILCIVLPKSYRSSTLILVEDQKIPENYVKGIVGSNVEERLTMIQQQVMSRTLLSQVINDFKLYPDQVRKEGIESVVELVRKGIKVDMFGTPGPGSRSSVEAFKISFAHENPMIAMKVTATVAGQFIEQNLKVREQLVEGASEFIEQELSLAKSRLEAQEQAISQFKTKYMGELPGQMEANLRALDRLQSDRTAITEGLGRLNDRLGMVEKAMKEYETTGVTSPGLPTATVKPLDPVATRLKELERNLATLSAEYKDNYPDIVSTKLEIEKVKAQLAGRLSDKETTSTAQSISIDPYLRELHKQRDEIKIDITSLKDRQVHLTSQMREFEGRVERSPAREQELMILLRDYGNLQENYRSLLDKKLNARVAENLEKRQKGEQFRIIDPANLPEKPEKPDILRIMLMGLAIGCALGVGVPIGLEQVQPAFRRSEEVESMLGLPILASIPSFHTAFGMSLRSSTKLLAHSSLPAKVTSVQPLFLETNQTESNGNGHAHTPNGNGKAWAYPWAKWKASQTPVQEFPLELNLVSKWRPWSVVTEQFRVAATRLTLMQGNRGSTVIVVTSAVKGEGKSAVAVNLGYVLARDLGKSTLIIDADLKRPVVHGYMGNTLAPGLQDLLEGEQSIDACLHSQGELPLWVMPSGTQSDETIELSKINRLNDILHQLRGRFDYIILDAPPILPLADMHVLSGMADIVALVIRAGVTKQSVVQKALTTLKPTSSPCIVLNGLQAEVVPYYMQEGFDYFSKKKELPRV